jgi:hypothetical protein
MLLARHRKRLVPPLVNMAQSRISPVLLPSPNMSEKDSEKDMHCKAKRTCIANQAPSDRIVCRRSSNTCISSELRSSVAGALRVLSTFLP